MSPTQAQPLPLTKDDWLARCAARFIARGGLAPELAPEYAEACFESDGTGYFSDDPEGSADEDMSCWSD